MVNVLVISDTHLHQSEDMPQIIWQKAKQCDLVIHAGDITRKIVFDDLSTCAQVEAVRGNMDVSTDTFDLPLKKHITFGGLSIGIVHGAGSSEGAIRIARRSFSDVDIIIFGHSHFPEIKQVKGVIMFNPGSPTQPRSSPCPTFGWIEIEKNRIQFSIKSLEGFEQKSLIWKQSFQGIS